jgi:hypothetical protein
MNQSKKIVVIAGYARAGKTTSLGMLEQLGYEAISTSLVLHKQTQKLYYQLCGRDLDTGNKQTAFQLHSTGNKTAHFSMRDLLIAVAESTREFDPSFYVKEAIRCVKESESHLVALETIGGEEWLETARLLQELGLEFSAYNIRSPYECKGVDIRELIPCATDIWNQGDRHDLFKKIVEVA